MVIEMKIGYLQFDIKRDEVANINIIDNLLSKKRGDLFVLPELINHGYLFTDKEEVYKYSHIVPNSDFIQKMCQLSSKYNCCLIFGIIEKENDNLFNTAVIVNKGQYVDKYRKKHLSDYEKKYYSSGDKETIVKINGVRIGIQICFDLWFPEISRYYLKRKVDLMCVLGNFGNKNTFDIARTRSLENVTPVVLANRIGEEKNTEINATFFGHSTIINHLGKNVKLTTKMINDIQVIDYDFSFNKGNVICHDILEEILKER